MKVTYGGDEPRYLPATGTVVAPGDTVDVDKAAAEGLLDQPDWSAPKPTNKKEGQA